MAILNGVAVPHPPLILAQVGRGEEKRISKTIDAYGRAARFVAEARPDTIVVITPHSAMYADWFHLSPGEGARGNFAQFGAGGLEISARYDTQFVKALCDAAKRAGFPAGTQGEVSAALDHATMIPLYFLREAYGDEAPPAIVRVGLSGLPLAEHYKLGMMIRDAARSLARNISVIASGDLSHRLKADGPYGYRAEGPQYDARVMDALGRGAFGELLDFSKSFCEAAGECGHRSFTILAGCFDGLNVRASALSYEGPFGVGYGVCLFSPEGADSSREFLNVQLQGEAERLRQLKEREDAYTRLARLSVETYVLTGRRARLPQGLGDDLTKKRAGVFVSLHKGGQLRGCIGTISPATGCIAEEILQNGVSACSKDPRFSPVTKEELAQIEYNVDVLGEAEPIDGVDELDAKRYGVIVSSGYKRGLLLPDLEGVDTVEDQIAIARRKAGIGPGEQIRLERFEVVRHV